MRPASQVRPDGIDARGVLRTCGLHPNATSSWSEQTRKSPRRPPPAALEAESAPRGANERQQAPQTVDSVDRAPCRTSRACTLPVPPWAVESPSVACLPGVSRFGPVPSPPVLNHCADPTLACCYGSSGQERRRADRAARGNRSRQLCVRPCSLVSVPPCTCCAAPRSTFRTPGAGAPTGSHLRHDRLVRSCAGTCLQVRRAAGSGYRGGHAPTRRFPSLAMERVRTAASAAHAILWLAPRA